MHDHDRPERRRIGQWRKADTAQEFFDLYDALRAEYFEELRAGGWGVLPDEADVETRFGSTRVYHWPGTGEPIVLVPGAGAPSLMWVPLVGELVGRSVYAVDTLGDVGRSVQQLPMPDREDLAVWLDDVFDGSNLDRVHIVGASYGAWVALTYARHSPERVASLVLLEPVLGKIRPLFWIHGLASGLALIMPSPIRRRAARTLHMNLLAVDDRRIRRLGFLAQARFRRGVPKFVPVADDELAAIATRTMVLLGQRSQVHRSDALLARLRSVAPRLEVEIVPGAGHSLPVDDVAVVGRRLALFLDRDVEGV